MYQGVVTFVLFFLLCPNLANADQSLSQTEFILTNSTKKMDIVQNFTRQTDTFKINLILTKTSLLMIFYDYQNWKLYFKEFTQNDIGKQINRKNQLSDVLNAFKCKTDEKDSQNYKIQTYKFGDIAKFQTIPCFRIETDGKLTTFLSIINSGSKQTSVFESSMKLNFIRKISELEILQHKYDALKSEHEDLIIYMEYYIKENSRLRKLLQKTKIKSFQITKEHYLQVSDELQIVDKSITHLKIKTVSFSQSQSK